MIAAVFANWKYAVIAVLLAFCGVQQVRIDHAHQQYASFRQQVAEEREKVAAAALKAEQDARAEEERREQRMMEIQNEADHETEVARAAARDSDNAASGLRDRLAAYVSAVRRATADTGTVKPSASVQGPDPIGVLGRLFSESDEASGAVAEYADRLHVAGAACEAAFDGLRQ